MLTGPELKAVLRMGQSIENAQRLRGTQPSSTERPGVPEPRKGPRDLYEFDFVEYTTKDGNTLYIPKGEK